MAEKRIAELLAQITREINAPDSLEGTLESIARAAATSIDGIDHVGVSLSHRDGRIETVAATDPFVEELDTLQYKLHEGPCVFAIEREPVVLVEHARQEQRWPRYIPQAVQAGLRSQLALQLFGEEDTLGGLNLYSTTSDTLDPWAVYTAELFATHAAIALGKSRKLDQMSEALDSRQVIGEAVGITMQRYRVDQKVAFQFLVRLSSTRNVKLRLVAQEIVDEAETMALAPDDAARTSRPAADQT